ncbi:MAG: TAT-variant-translocated molybdopterin oxidoreductase [Thermoanaerobaculia bacterium]
MTSDLRAPQGGTLDDHGKCSAEKGKPCACGGAPVDLAAVRERLAESRGPRYWRSLEELAATPEFEAMLHREFPRLASEWPEGVSRRNFLQLTAASLGLAGLTACTRQPIEKIVPYVKQPEEIVPGRAMSFATAMPLAGYAIGLLVESQMGRPTKIEGNPGHPASLGATDAVTQASVLGLYDPDRSQAPTYLGEIRAWRDLVGILGPAMSAQRALGGAGLRVLTGATGSPTLGALVEQLLAEFPQAKWHRWDPLARDAARAAAVAAFGAPVETRFDLAKADVVVALESDFLVSGPGAVRYARDFAARRKVSETVRGINRLYVFESSPTPTGASADHRFALRPSQMPLVALALANRLGVAGTSAPSGLPAEIARAVDVMARDLASRRGAALVVAGDTLPAEIHTLVHGINAALGALGATVIASDPVECAPVDHSASIAELAEALRAGKVDLLLVCGSNPVFDAPADVDFAGALVAAKGTLKIHHGLYQDETAEFCEWHVPAAHYLESWGDARAFDGTVTVLQPLIEPLYGGKTEIEMVAALLGRGTALAYDLVQEYWQSRLAGDDFDAAFRAALHDGAVPATAYGEKTVAPSPDAVAAAAATLAGASGAATGLEVALRFDSSVLDGRFANNGWLQELPKPLTKLTWDNAVLLSPRTAERLKVAGEDLVEVAVGGRKVTGPVWILPGQADEVATIHLGYGRRRAGKIATGIGFDAQSLATRAARFALPQAEIRPTGETLPLATTQGHHALEWMREETVEAETRDVVREATFAEFERNPRFAQQTEPGAADPNVSFAPGYDYSQGYSWGMAIDLSACTGCNACVVACVAENNIPVVGKEQVRRGREMQWIRVDRYFRGDVDGPDGMVFQPLPCMQCEQAPCETVCPVAATTHSSEGLNDMVYNRCVGTRYCSNNCPYKVRRFNFLLYQDFDTPQFKLQRNPDVSVRSRGVMEKCTYCVQRINQARIAAEREGRTIQAGEIVTACQQACPSNAIAFGNLNDAAERVVEWKASPRNYSLLEELGTRPRTTYLALVKNPHPELV